MKDLMVKLLKDEDGQGMVEYGIIIALISVVAIAVIKTIGDKTKTGYEKVANCLEGPEGCK